jgi:imidazoleglycerol phosphate synthase glutamine amidotransferase subunit HisH
MEVILIDSPVANVANIARALRAAGAELRVTRDREAIAGARKLVLPGVGTFTAAMRWLEETRIDDAIRDAVTSGAALLGICVGHQVLFDVSYEMGLTRGLGLIHGEVKQYEGTLPVPQIGWNCVTATDRAPSPGLRPSSPRSAGRGISIETFSPEPPSETLLPRGSHGTGRGLSSRTIQSEAAESETLLPRGSGGEGGRRPDEGAFDSPLFDGIPNGTAFYFVNSYAATNIECEIAHADYGGPFTAAVQNGRVFGVQFHPEKSSTAGLRVLRNYVEKVR